MNKIDLDYIEAKKNIAVADQDIEELKKTKEELEAELEQEKENLRKSIFWRNVSSIYLGLSIIMLVATALIKFTMR